MAQRSWVDRTRPLWRLGNKWEVLLLRWLGTSGMSILRRTPLLVIETTGRRTGKRRAAPVAYWQDRDTFFIGGGAAGMSRVDWVANLRAQRSATIVVRRRRIDVEVHELKDDEYDSARAHAVDLWPSIPKYERMSDRPAPFFRLTPDRTDETR